MAITWQVCIPLAPLHPDAAVGLTSSHSQGSLARKQKDARPLAWSYPAVEFRLANYLGVLRDL